MSQHTPGPSAQGRTHDHRNGRSACAVCGFHSEPALTPAMLQVIRPSCPGLNATHDDRTLRCDECARTPVTPATEKNARLIAKAPEMLEILRYVASGVSDEDQHLEERARALLREIEG